MTNQPAADDLRRNCLAACWRCVEACEACSGLLLSGSDMLDVTGECLRRSRDSADVSALCARLLGRGSSLYMAVCLLCAAACEHCSEECVRHDHEVCQRCSSACLECAQSCRQLAQVAGSG